MKAVISVIIIAFALSLTSCSWKRVAMPGIAMPDKVKIAPLERKDYRILQTAEGRGCATFIGLFPIPIFFTMSEHVKVDIWGLDISGRARRVAVYKAIESVPGADALLAPRFHEEITSGGIWYRKTCVTVKGKAIKLTEDR